MVPIAAGDLVHADYQYEFKGFLFGSGTDFQVESIEGILGLPSARSSDDENQEDHGEHPGIDTAPGRTVTGKMNVLGTMNDVQSKIDEATAAFQVSKRAAFTEFQFVTRRPGHTRRFCWARPRRCEFPSNYDTARGKAVGAFQLHATDPRFYSLKGTSTSMQIPLDGASVQAEVPMNGDFLDGTHPIITITGPSTNPRITNEEDNGRTIRIDIVVGVAQTLVIDTKLKTVFLDGVDRYDTVRADNQWWVLVPGSNTIVYNRSGGGAESTLTVDHHDAWTGA